MKTKPTKKLLALLLAVVLLAASVPLALLNASAADPVTNTTIDFSAPGGHFRDVPPETTVFGSRHIASHTPISYVFEIDNSANAYGMCLDGIWKDAVSSTYPNPEIVFKTANDSPVVMNINVHTADMPKFYASDSATGPWTEITGSDYTNTHISTDGSGVALHKFVIDGIGDGNTFFRFQYNSTLGYSIFLKDVSFNKVAPTVDFVSGVLERPFDVNTLDGVFSSTAGSWVWDRDATLGLMLFYSSTTEAEVVFKTVANSYAILNFTFYDTPVMPVIYASPDRSNWTDITNDFTKTGGNYAIDGIGAGNIYLKVKFLPQETDRNYRVSLQDITFDKAVPTINFRAPAEGGSGTAGLSELRSYTGSWGIEAGHGLALAYGSLGNYEMIFHTDDNSSIDMIMTLHNSAVANDCVPKFYAASVPGGPWTDITDDFNLDPASVADMQTHRYLVDGIGAGNIFFKIVYNAVAGYSYGAFISEITYTPAPPTINFRAVANGGLGTGGLSKLYSYTGGWEVDGNYGILLGYTLNGNFETAFKTADNSPINLTLGIHDQAVSNDCLPKFYTAASASGPWTDITDDLTVTPGDPAGVQSHNYKIAGIGEGNVFFKIVYKALFTPNPEDPSSPLVAYNYGVFLTEITYDPAAPYVPPVTDTTLDFALGADEPANPDNNGAPYCEAFQEFVAAEDDIVLTSTIMWGLGLWEGGLSYHSNASGKPFFVTRVADNSPAILTMLLHDSFFAKPENTPKLYASSKATGPWTEITADNYIRQDAPTTYKTYAYTERTIYIDEIGAGNTFFKFEFPDVSLISNNYIFLLSDLSYNKSDYVPPVTNTDTEIDFVWDALALTQVMSFTQGAFTQGENGLMVDYDYIGGQLSVPKPSLVVSVASGSSLIVNTLVHPKADDVGPMKFYASVDGTTWVELEEPTMNYGTTNANGYDETQYVFAALGNSGYKYVKIEFPNEKDYSDEIGDAAQYVYVLQSVLFLDGGENGIVVDDVDPGDDDPADPDVTGSVDTGVEDSATLLLIIGFAAAAGITVTMVRRRKRKA